MAARPTDVEVKSFLIADQVFQQRSGKWCVIGVFSQIRARQFPCLHPSLGLYVSLANCEGEFQVRVEFEDSEGRCLATLPEIGLRASNRLVLSEFGIQTHSMLVPAPGTYFVKLYFNGRQATSDIRFEAALAEENDGDN